MIGSLRLGDRDHELVKVARGFNTCSFHGDRCAAGFACWAKGGVFRPTTWHMISGMALCHKIDADSGMCRLPLKPLKSVTPSDRDGCIDVGRAMVSRPRPASTIRYRRAHQITHSVAVIERVNVQY